MSIGNKEINYILNSLKEIEYGLITITVHGGKIMQVDSTKKERFKNQNDRLNVRKTDQPTIYG